MEKQLITPIRAIDLLSNEWVQSPVGRALHRCRRGHGFESYWSHMKFSGVYKKQLLQIVLISAGTHEPNKWTCSQLYGFIAQLVEHCTGIAEVIDSRPPEFFRCLQQTMITCLFRLSPALQTNFYFLEGYMKTLVTLDSDFLEIDKVIRPLNT